MIVNAQKTNFGNIGILMLYEDEKLHFLIKFIEVFNWFKTLKWEHFDETKDTIN